MKKSSMGARMAITALLLALIVPAQQREPDWSGIATMSSYQKIGGVFVLDTKTNSYVTTIPPERFRVREKASGEEWSEWKTPVSVQSGVSPLRIVCEMDVSTSLKNYYGEVKNTVLNILNTVVQPEKDAVLLIPFGVQGLPGSRYIDSSRTFTNDLARLKTELNTIPSGATTALFDVLLAGVERLQQPGIGPSENGFRKVIMIVTDGQENASAFSTCPAKDAACRAAEKIPRNRVEAYARKKKFTEQELFHANIPVYILFTGSNEDLQRSLVSDWNTGEPVGIWVESGRASSFGTVDQWLSLITRNTGGSVFRFRSDREREGALKRITQELSHKYWVVFNTGIPRPNETERKLGVSVIAVDAQGKPLTDKHGRVKADSRYKVAVSPDKFYFDVHRQ